MVVGGGGGSCLSLLRLQYVLPCLPGLIFFKVYFVGWDVVDEYVWNYSYSDLHGDLHAMLYRWGRVSQQVPAPVGIERQMKESAVELPASERACISEQSGPGCLLKEEFFYFKKHLWRSALFLTLKSRDLVNTSKGILVTAPSLWYQESVMGPNMPSVHFWLAE